MVLMPSAFVAPFDFRTHFRAGLARAGFTLTDDAGRPEPGDVMIVYNRRSLWASATRRAWLKRGATVIVIDNGFVYPTGTLYLSFRGGPSIERPGRWAALGIELQPWREAGEHILVLPQRGMGLSDVVMPLDWAASASNRLRALSHRPILVRPPQARREALDFAGAWAVATWGSSAAIKAIIAGVPAFYELDGWAGAPAARYGLEDPERPFLGDRLPMLRHIASRQWTLAEIESGEPFTASRAPSPHRARRGKSHRRGSANTLSERA